MAFETTIVDVTADELQRSELRRMQRIATLLLLLVTALYICSRIEELRTPGFVWLRVFSEAAMIGGIADWFAVSALFRHPLGLPIPHTAIIPRNKDRIARMMGTFVQENFLSEKAVGERLGQIDFAQIIARWLSDEENINLVSRKTASVLPALLDSLTHADVKRLVIFQVESLAESGFGLSSMAGTFLTLLISADRDQAVVSEILKLIDELLVRHSAYVSEQIKGELPWYVPGFVHDQVYAAALKRIRETTKQVSEDPEHDIRGRIVGALLGFAERLKTSPDYRRRGQEILRKLSSSPLFIDYGAQLWEDVTNAIKEDNTLPESKTVMLVSEVLRSFAKGISRDKETQNHINTLLRSQIRQLVRDHSATIVEFISDTVSRWDTRTTVEKLELQLGRDLQYIRFNGTLVGGLVGLIIHSLSLLLPI